MLECDCNRYLHIREDSDYIAVDHKKKIIFRNIAVSMISASQLGTKMPKYFQILLFAVIAFHCL